MSADLHLIIINPEHLSVEKVKEYNQTLNYDLTLSDEELHSNLDRNSELSRFIYDNMETNFKDDLWIGQVSWMKESSLDKGWGEYVPAVVANTQNLYNKEAGGVIQLTEDTVATILTGFDLPSESVYEVKEGFRGITTKDEARKFLLNHLGEYSFVDSW